MNTSARCGRRAALVTGASSGIGLMTAIHLLRLGYDVLGTGTRPLPPVKLRRLVADGALTYVPADLANPEEVDRLAALANQFCPRMSALIHSAGIYVDDTDCVSDPLIGERVMSVNFFSAARLTSRLEDRLVKAKGNVVFIGSSAASEPSERNGMYAASKAALQTYAKSLRKRLNPMGVRVVSLSIGRTNTPMQAAIAARTGAVANSRYLVAPESLAAITAFIVGLPQDVEVTDVSARPLRRPPL